jgi:hypothetical protein
MKLNLFSWQVQSGGGGVNETGAGPRAEPPQVDVSFLP